MIISRAASAPLPDLDHVVPAPAGRIGEHLGLAGEQLREEAHVVGVVGDDEEVERTGELRPLAAGRRDLLALGEAVGVLRREPGAEGSGVQRERRVQVGVAEERPGREVAARWRRIRRPRLDLLGRLPIQCPDVRARKPDAKAERASRPARASRLRRVLLIGFLHRSIDSR